MSSSHQISSSQLPDPYEVGSVFPNMDAARAELKRVTIERGLSYKRHQHDHRRYVVVCTDKTGCCSFRLRFTIDQRTGKARTTISVPHSCSPDTHRDWRASSSVDYLSQAHRDLAEDKSASAATIRDREEERGHHISYKQAWRTFKRLRERTLSKIQDAALDGDMANKVGDSSSSDNETPVTSTSKPTASKRPSSNRLTSKDERSSKRLKRPALDGNKSNKVGDSSSTDNETPATSTPEPTASERPPSSRSNSKEEEPSKWFKRPSWALPAWKGGCSIWYAWEIQRSCPANSRVAPG
ncbi:hypothetical protein VTN49DRAFT_4789 [Thermomyces lanuginosus]|uniref:uncharacterized protein n=1 Tax=Thermomyces lanuginosus TaxID=5541 RepID=UPI003741F5DA